MDFGKKEDRTKYLEEKFDNLLDIIGETYGNVLMEELISRLDCAIDEFNQDMSKVLSEMKIKEDKRQKMYNMIKSGNIPSSDTDSTSNENDVSTEWEKKIEEIESKE